MFTYKADGLPIKVWMDESAYRSDEETVTQAERLSRHPYAYHHIALTPDAHAGMGATIGSVFALENAVCPNGVGVDIGCGMLAARSRWKAEEVDTSALRRIQAAIKHEIPTGFSHQTTDKYIRIANTMVYTHFHQCEEKGLPMFAGITAEVVKSQLGTLGGGNHFIELQTDQEGFVWVMIHSGSRNLGLQIANHHAKIAKKEMERYKTPLPHPDLSILLADSTKGRTYLDDMGFAMKFAKKNRTVMFREIQDIMHDVLGMRAFDFDANDINDNTSPNCVGIHHNFVDIEHHFGKNVWVHRKGATRVCPGECGIIPGAMSTASYIVRGRDTEENIKSFRSCSHGAGRTMSRTKAKKTLSLDAFKDSMAGVVSTDVDVEHIDESEFAYKDINTVMSDQSELVEVVYELKPIMNCKG